MRAFLLDFNMSKIYLLLLLCAIIFAAYITGTKIAHEQCKTQIANQNTETAQKHIINTRKLNENIYKTSVRDIRDIMHAKYSIAD